MSERTLEDFELYQSYSHEIDEIKHKLDVISKLNSVDSTTDGYLDNHISDLRKMLSNLLISIEDGKEGIFSKTFNLNHKPFKRKTF